MASLLQQGRASQKKEEQLPSGPQGEGKGEGEKEKRESTSSTEDGQSRGAEHTSNEKREKGSAEERGKKGRETGGEMVAAKSAGAEGQEPKRPSSAEMMHRQQLEYQRYRYIHTVVVLSCEICCTVDREIFVIKFFIDNLS